MTREEAIAIRAAQLQGVPVTKRELEQAIAVLSRQPKARERLLTNPWGLTKCQCDVLATVTRVGGNEEAAAEMGVSPKTISAHIEKSMARMGMDKRLLAILEWDRFARNQGATQ